MMRFIKAKKLKILVFLFVLNSITLYLYFSDFFRTKHNHPQFAENLLTSHSLVTTAKPWPILPSYLPWSQNRHATLRSCEAYFGNGFNVQVDALKLSPEFFRKFGYDSSSSAGGGWLKCHHSETLISSICEGGKIRMNAEKILMSKGGEKLETVIGRREEEELPVFKFGAFQIEVTGRSKMGKKLVNADFLRNYLPNGAVNRHTVRQLVDSIELVGPDEFNCSEWVEEPTVLVTRFEYANVFHTFTDWYSAYVASRVTGLPNRPHIVFVDGHCETQLEETWNALFSSIKYAKSFSGPVCFRHAILAPLGYETAWFKGLSEDIECYGASARELWQHPDDKKTARLSEFGEMIRAAFGFPVNGHRTPRSVSGLNILFVRREDYLAHPRHGGKVQSRLSNEEQVFDAIKWWASNHSGCRLNIVNGLFAHMPMKEQVRAIQDASVIIGAHGAGLTHIVSAMPGTVVLEIISSEYRRPHFALIAKWKGLEYHAIYLDGSHANPPEVIDKLGSILRSLGC